VFRDTIETEELSSKVLVSHSSLESTVRTFVKEYTLMEDSARKKRTSDLVYWYEHWLWWGKGLPLFCDRVHCKRVLEWKISETGLNLLSNQVNGTLIPTQVSIVEWGILFLTFDGGKQKDFRSFPSWFRVHRFCFAVSFCFSWRCQLQLSWWSLIPDSSEIFVVFVVRHNLNSIIVPLFLEAD
jgi:hypothetical protein